MLLSSFIQESTAALGRLYPAPEARSMVLMLCEERLGVKSYTHIVIPSTEIPDEALPGLQEDMRRLLASEPLQYVLGFTMFYGRRFNVTPDVLIPRPETELLVDEAVKAGLALGRKLRVLDLCTGSGCIAWSLFQELQDADVVAVDISPAALGVARSQFGGPGPEFILADVLKDADSFDHGMFDIIVSNPPYVMEKEKPAMRANVLDNEPPIALFVPDDDPLLFYRAIAGWALRFLAPDGTCIVEINESLCAPTMEVFTRAGFRNAVGLCDLSRRFRMVKFTR